MKLRDILSIALGNLWRMKLRTALTTAGVVIAIAAFTAMVSFGVGMQSNIRSEFENLGLLTKVQIYPPSNRSEETDDTVAVRLDDAMIQRLTALPGVRFAFPLESFTVTARLADSSLQASVQSVAPSALEFEAFQHLLAGHALGKEDRHCALVMDSFLASCGLAPDSAVGRSLVIQKHVSSLDSGLVRVVHDLPPVRSLMRTISLDSLRYPHYVQRIARHQLTASLQSFSQGFFRDRTLLSDTLTIVGVLESRSVRALRLKEILVPDSVAEPFVASAAFDDPMTIYTSLQQGRIPGSSFDKLAGDYSKVTLELEPFTSTQSVADSARAWGLSAFSFAEQFDNIRKFFALFNSGLGAIGSIALLVAALGIVNTMVMSILERYREIGILKSLGADEAYIRGIFLIESAAIGVAGSLLGIVAGWLITRIAMGAAHIMLSKQDLPFVELFSLPLWLIGVALLFGLAVSLLAGLYPAARAAHVDAVVALRNE